MKKVIALISATVVAAVAAKAVVVQTITMKDGSVYRGYVKNSNAGQGMMSIHYDEAIVNISKDKASTVTTNDYDWKSLPREWKEWAKKAPNAAALKNQTFSIGSVAGRGNVRILENGVVVKYQTIIPDDCLIRASEVSRIDCMRRPETLVSGLDREYFLKNSRSLKGQYAGETDSTISVFAANGIKETFRRSDVQKIVITAVNPNQSTYEQAELVDVLNTESGSQFRGVVVEQNYMNKASQNYYIIEDEAGRRQTVNLLDVRSREIVENTSYKAVNDVILREGEVVVNRQAVYAPVKVGENAAQQLVVDTVGPKIAVSKDSVIRVEFNDPANAGKDKFKMVRLTNHQAKKHIYSCFTYKDLAESEGLYRTSALPLTSPNGTTLVEYRVSKVGVYVLYDGKKGEAYLLEAK